MPYVLGIDIGGTTTTAAISRLRGAGWSPPEVVRLGARSHSVPSVLHVAADGALTVGDPVQPEADRMARGFIRRVGDDVSLVVGGEPCTPQALTAVLAMWVVERVLAQENAPAEQVVISHPASWGPYRRAVLHRALWDIGLANVTLLPAPVVAAESHAAREWVGSTLAVYALGGNDFETSVVRWADGFGFRLLGCAGAADQFGGGDVDEALANLVEEKLGGQFRELRKAGPQARLALFGLRHECLRAKERLTTATDTEVLVPLPQGQVPVPVTRAELERLIRPALEVTVEALTDTVRSCRPAAQQLDGVLLVGGAARMPLVAELVAAALPGPVAIEPEPQSTAAAGAAVAAGKIATPPEARGRSPVTRADRADRAAPRSAAPASGAPAAAPRSPVPGSAPPGSPAVSGPPDLVPEGELGAGPPPRPPVKIKPLQLGRARSGQRLFGLVGGGR